MKNTRSLKRTTRNRKSRILDVEELLAVVVVVQPVGAGKLGQVLDLVFQLGLFERKRVAGGLGLGQSKYLRTQPRFSGNVLDLSAHSSA